MKKFFTKAAVLLATMSIGVGSCFIPVEAGTHHYYRSSYQSYQAQKQRDYQTYQREKEQSYRNNRGKSYSERRKDYESVYNRNQERRNNTYYQYHRYKY